MLGDVDRRREIDKLRDDGERRCHVLRKERLQHVQCCKKVRALGSESIIISMEQPLSTLR